MELLLYLVTDPALTKGRPLLAEVAAALSGGVTAVQLRDKLAAPRELLAMGAEMRRIVRQHQATFLVNDRPDMALALEADGVHLCLEDFPPGEARRLLPRPQILGVSAANVHEARAAEESGADYLGVGPVFSSRTKPDAGEPLGLEVLASIAASVSIPVVGIGGITLESAASVIEAGAIGIAVISAVMGAPDPAEAAHALRARVEAARSRGRTGTRLGEA